MEHRGGRKKRESSEGIGKKREKTLLRSLFLDGQRQAEARFSVPVCRALLRGPSTLPSRRGVLDLTVCARVTESRSLLFCRSLCIFRTDLEMMHSIRSSIVESVRVAEIFRYPFLYSGFLTTTIVTNESLRLSIYDIWPRAIEKETNLSV